jgi:hypothetical protein
VEPVSRSPESAEGKRVREVRSSKKSSLSYSPASSQFKQVFAFMLCVSPRFALIPRLPLGKTRGFGSLGITAPGAAAAMVTSSWVRDDMFYGE